MSKYIVKNTMKTSCYTNYHHYNSNAASFYKDNQSKVKIGGFNLWHPGSANTAYKDFDLLAKTINKVDVLGAVELLPLVGSDKKNNLFVTNFIKKAPALIASLKTKISNTTNISVKTKLVKKLNILTQDYKKAPNIFRSTGYLKILFALRKLDKSWALILSPRGESAKKTGIQELVGFFYRGRIVKPVVNEHCKEFKNAGDGVPYGCVPNLWKSFMGRDVTKVFSRRPFLSSFKSGKFDFTLVASHVIFGSPSDAASMKKILIPTFGVSSYTSLGRGFSKKTYARYAEVKTTMEFMNEYRKQYKEQDVIYVGDMNLEASDKRLQEMLLDMPGAKLKITDKTTITVRKYDSKTGKATNGVASSYDHFVYDPRASNECSGAKKISFYSGDIRQYVHKNYIVRDRNLNIPSEGKIKIKLALAKYKSKLDRLRTISKNKIIQDKRNYQRKLDNYKKWVFTDQTDVKNFYRVYKQLMSDHMAIAMSCTTSKYDDD